MYNASIRLLRPNSSPSGTDGLDREHTDDVTPALRCRVARKSSSSVAFAFGVTGVEVYTVRLVTRERVEAGWQVEIRRDGEVEWHGYTVMGRDGQGHCALTVRRN